MSARRGRGVLATKVLRIALTVSAIIIGVFVVVSAVSTSTLTTQSARDRNLRGVQTLEDDIQTHLRRVESAISAAIGEGDTRDEMRLGIVRLYASREGDIEQVVMADRQGRLISVQPANAEVGRVRTMPAFVAALEGRTGFLSVATDEGGTELWATRTVFDDARQPVLVLARLDLGFAKEATAALSEEMAQRTFYLLQGDQTVARAGEQETTFKSARWTPDDEQGGSVRVVTPAGVVLQGNYNSITGIEEIGWRAVVVAPMSQQLYEITRVILPPVLVLVAGGAVSLVVAWVGSQRLSRPLRELERAALAGASGSYVRPVSTNRDDEFGRVSEAFNAFALRLNALQDLAQLLSSATSLDQVLDASLTATVHLVDSGSVAVYLLDHASGELVPVRTHGLALAEARPIPDTENGWLGQLMHANLAGDFDAEQRELAHELPGIISLPQNVFAAPLVAGTEPLGAVVVTCRPDREFIQAERDMVRTFSAQAAVAVQTSRLFKDEQGARRSAEALRAVAEQLVSPPSLAVALSRVEDIITDLFAARGASIILADPDALGMREEGQPTVAGLSFEATRAVLRDGDGKPRAVSREDDFLASEVLADPTARQGLLVPIALETDHGAVLSIALDEPPTHEVVEFAQAIGDEIALALNNAYFYQSALARAANLETVFRISQAVGSSLQVNVVLNRVLDVVQKILSAEAVVLMEWDPQRRVLKTAMARGDMPRDVVQAELQDGEDIAGQVFRLGAPASFPDLSTVNDGLGRSASKHGLGSMLAVPLLARGRSIGVLMVFATETSAFKDEDLNTLQTFASQAALAIDTARLYSREHEVASVLQASILPDELPVFDELELGSVYAPAGGEAEIGGDYYDVFRSPDGLIWIAIADVCGKGVSAATKTSMIKYVVRALAVTGRGPGRIIAQINDMIAQGGDPSEIVTAWLGCYDHATGTLRWADGGHPPALLQHAQGTFTQLGVTGPLLGALVGAAYEELEVVVQDGDRVLLYTDGVTEARGRDIFFGEERIKEVMQARVAPAQLARLLLVAVREHVEGELRDDVAVLVVAPKAPAPSGSPGARGTEEA